MPSIDAYLTRCEKCGIYPVFLGYNPFETLVETWRIRENSIIKVRSHDGIDDNYIVTKYGKLEYLPVGDQRKSGKFDPKVVLSKEKAPKGWEVERLFPSK